MSPGEFQLPPLGGSSKPSRGSDPSFFQTSASVLGLGACKILCYTLLRAGSLSPTGPAGLQSQTLWVLIFPVQDPQAGESDVGLRSLTPWGAPLQVLSSLHLWVIHPGMWFLTSMSLPLLYLILKDSCSLNSCNFGVLMGEISSEF